MKKILALVGFVICLMLLVASMVVCVYNTISLNNNFTAVKDRAQTLGDANGIESLLIELDIRMEDRGLTEGYTSRWNHNVWTDMSEIKKNVENLIVRSDEIRQLPHESDAYQSGLDDLRGNLRELNLQVFGWWTWSHGGWVYLWLLGPLSTILGIVCAWVFFTTEERRYYR